MCEPLGYWLIGGIGIVAVVGVMVVCWWAIKEIKEATS